MWVFEKTSYFYLLLVLPVLAGLFIYTLYWQRKKKAIFGNNNLINKLTPSRSAARVWLKFVLLVMAVTAIIIGLVNPKGGQRLEMVQQQGLDIVFAIDVSKSMLAEDVAPNRLSKTRQIVSQVINRLGSDRIGIVAYAGSAYPVLPMTADFGLARTYLQGLNTNMVSSQGTAIGEAIQLSTSFFEGNNTSRVLVLLTDGEDHGGDIDKIIAQAVKNNLKIVTVGIGTEEGGPIPLKEDGITKEFKADKDGQTVVTRLVPDELKRIAQTTKGKYIYSGSAKETANNILKAMDRIEKKDYESRNLAALDSQYQWFAGLAFIFLLIDVFVSEGKTNYIRRSNFFKKG